MEICIDFDGTCTTHEFPKVGKDIGATPVLKELVENGHQLSLFTMRSNGTNGNFLDDAVNWFKNNGIKLYGIQYNPTQKDWTNSNKAYGQLYIDDAALGCPVKRDFCPQAQRGLCFDNCKTCGGSGYIGRNYVCWETVRNKLIEMNLIRPTK